MEEEKVTRAQAEGLMYDELVLAVLAKTAKSSPDALREAVATYVAADYVDEVIRIMGEKIDDAIADQPSTDALGVWYTLDNESSCITVEDEVLRGVELSMTLVVEDEQLEREEYDSDEEYEQGLLELGSVLHAKSIMNRLADLDGCTLEGYDPDAVAPGYRCKLVLDPAKTGGILEVIDHVFWAKDEVWERKMGERSQPCSNS